MLTVVYSARQNLSVNSTKTTCLYSSKNCVNTVSTSFVISLLIFLYFLLILFIISDENTILKVFSLIF